VHVQPYSHNWASRQKITPVDLHLYVPVTSFYAFERGKPSALHTSHMYVGTIGTFRHLDFLYCS
jgi:hypothetical protein